MNANEAIDLSIKHSQIVHMRPTDLGEFLAAELDLAAACEDNVDPEPGLIEFWGTRDGKDWRVHLVKPGSER